MSGIFNAIELIISANNGQAITGVRAVNREVQLLGKDLDAVGSRSGVGMSKAATQIERETKRIAAAQLKLQEIQEDIARKEIARNAARQIQFDIDDTRLEGRNPNSKGARLINLGIDKRDVTEFAADETERVKIGRQVAATQDEITEATLRRAAAERALAAETTASSRATLLANGAAKGGLLAIGVGVAVSAAAASKFDETMRNVNSIQIQAGESAQASSERFKEQSDAITALSRTVPQSANSLAEGLYEIASSGFQGADGLRVLEVAARAATAGVSDTDTAAKAIVSVLNTFGLSAASAGDVSDTLFQTVKDGVIRFDELATALNYSVNAASTAGISYGEMGAALATLTRNGVQGARSGVIFANVIAKIITPSKQLAALFRANGFESGAAALQQLKLAGVMELIRTSTGGAAAGLAQLFTEQRAFRGAASLIANDGKTLAEEMERIGTSTGRAGATQRTFQEQMKATSNRIRVSINEIAADAIKIGQAFLPTVEAVVAVLATLVDVLADNRQAVVVLGALLAGQLTKGYLAAALGAVGLTKSTVTATTALVAQGVAAEGAAKATGLFAGISGAVVTGGLILALGLVAKGFIDARRSVNDYIADVKAASDTSTTAGLNEVADTLQKTLTLSGLSSKKSFLGFGFDHGNKLATQIRQLRQEAAQLDLVTSEVGKKLGVSFAAGSEELATFQRNIKAAGKSLEIDLSKPITRSQLNELALALTSVTAAAGQAPAVLGQLGVNFDELAASVENSTLEVIKFSDAAAKAFSQDFKIVADFKLPDPKELDDKIAAARQKIVDIQQEKADVAAARDDARSKKESDKRISRLKAELAAVDALSSKAPHRTFESAIAQGLTLTEAYKAAAKSQDDQSDERRAARRKKLEQRISDAEGNRDNPRVNPADARRDARLKVQEREANKSLNELLEQKKPGAASKALSAQLDADVALAEKYPKLIAEAVARNLNPNTLDEILQAGPKSATDTLTALLSDSSQKTINQLNDTEERLRAGTEKIRELGRIRALAFTPVAGDELGALDRRKADFKTAVSISELLSQQPKVGPRLNSATIAKLLGITSAEVGRVTKEFAIFPSDIATPASDIEKKANFGQTALALGANSAMQIRDLLGQAAGITFNNLAKLGFPVTAAPAYQIPTAIGGAGPLTPKYPSTPLPVTASLPTTRVLTATSPGARMPQSVSIKNETNFNGPVQGTTPEQAAKWAKQQFRIASTTGRRGPP